MGDRPIQPVIQSVSIGTMLNNNGLNIGGGLNFVTCKCSLVLLLCTLVVLYPCAMPLHPWALVPHALKHSRTLLPFHPCAFAPARLCALVPLCHHTIAPLCACVQCPYALSRGCIISLPVWFHVPSEGVFAY